MTDIILAAGYATRLYPLTEHFPKALLPVGDSTILERLVQDIDSIDGITQHILVSNHKFAAHFEEWRAHHATRHPFLLLDDGTESNETRRGAVSDLLLALDTYAVADDILVAAADNILDFSLATFVQYFHEKETSVIMCYHEADTARLHSMGVVVIDDEQRVVAMQEKPQVPASQWATPPFYIYKASDLPLIRASIDNGCGADAPGHLAHYLSARTVLHAFPMPGHRYDIGSPSTYAATRRLFQQQ